MKKNQKMTITHDLRETPKDRKEALKMLREHEDNSKLVVKNNMIKFLTDLENAAGEMAKYSKEDNCIYLLENEILENKKFIDLKI